ncbi:MAG TPA: hypothetical protein VF760_03585 [Xanthobacteraceae bacterium]|jgi:hypothetical protein
MRAPDATRSANFAAGMGFALVTAVGWGLNWPVPKYLLTELPLLSGIVIPATVLALADHVIE